MSGRICLLRIMVARSVQKYVFSIYSGGPSNDNQETFRRESLAKTSTLNDKTGEKLISSTGLKSSFLLLCRGLPIWESSYVSALLFKVGMKVQVELGHFSCPSEH